MLKIIMAVVGLLTFNTALSEELLIFQPQSSIKASELNSNFNHIKGKFQSKNKTLNFSQYTSGSTIELNQLEGDFDLVRALGVTVDPLSDGLIISEQINHSFQQMLTGSVSYDDIPLVQNQSLSTNEDQVLNSQVSFQNSVGVSQVQIQVFPAHGSVSLNPSTGAFSYNPHSNFFGSDSFTFRVFDGVNTSELANVSIQVVSVNDAPTASAQSISTNEDISKAITLIANDVDGDALTYSIVSAPAKGVLNGIAPNLTYVPNLNANGSDSFSFKVNDGQVDSNTASVNISITAVDDAPVSFPQSIALDEDTSKSIVLSGQDPDGESITYEIVNGPAHGQLSGTVPNVTYTPVADYSGLDSFTFRVKDPHSSSNISTIELIINEVNDAPVVLALSTVESPKNNSVSGNLTATDVEGQTLSFSKNSEPAKGSVVVNTNGTFTYTPTTDAKGNDSFTVSASDGISQSTPQTVSVYIKSCSGSLGPLNVTTDMSIAEGAARDYSSITVASGKTLTISGNVGTWTEFCSSGNVVINGTILVRAGAPGGATPAGKTVSKTSAFGLGALSHTIVQSLGGNGGSGNNTAGGTNNTLGMGGGGGAGAGSGVGGRNGANGTGGSAGSGGGYGAGGDAGGGCCRYNGGNGASGGAGAGSDAGNGGAGGGYKGIHGKPFALIVDGTISGTGAIVATGTNGYAGGDAANEYSSGGGGGGGGAGGSGGTIIFATRSSVPSNFTSTSNVARGTGGAAGRGYKGGSNGGAGVAGVAGSIEVINLAE